ncbi:sporulation inhibitor of replication protein SirA [Oceanobacillus sp. Castelsardo]|uniref:sporulation inhibitor of replication protein SirA n=1 Tax=Oceanobacillus sp. Castelsardo TaxID=1851204 RepID=UPI0008383D03|nr:sporulation inhibitor of replication protein SirA [Oceanobacillus sp. Castelsardo]
MYDYSIYWIKQEIANHYFHKSDILYRFFEEYHHNKNRIDLRKQFLYITKNIEKDTIISILKYNLKDDVQIKQNGSTSEIYDNGHFISLHIDKKQLNFRSRSLQDAEEFLFPVLRLIHPLFFVVGHRDQNYGWISPIKFPRNIDRNQVLYSCR